MSGKQEGVSNTDTKFPVDLMGDHPTPHKGEGIPETAKSKGTIDPYRPQVIDPCFHVVVVLLSKGDELTQYALNV